MKKLSLNKIKVAKLSRVQLLNMKGGSQNDGEGGERSSPDRPILCNRSGSGIGGGDLIVKIQNAY